MPEFLAPWYLMAAAAAAVPLIIHLLHRHKPRPLVFSTLRFLREAMVKTQRARRLTQIFMLLLRILILLLLALAFARPKIARHQAMPGERRTALLVLDATASLQVRDAGKALFQQARERALKLADTFAKNDRVGLVVAGIAEPRVLFPPSSEPDALFTALREAKPGHGAANLPRLLLDLLKSLPEGTDKSALEIHLFTDCQSTDWPANDLKPLAEELERHGMILFLNQVLAGPITNAGIAKVSLSPPAAFGAGPIEVNVTLQGSPEFTGSETATFQLGGREQDRQAVSGLAGQKVPVTLKGTVESGTDSVPGRIEIGTDAYDLDNLFHFCLPRVSAVPVLLVEPAAGGPEDFAETLFVRMALQPGGKARSLFTPVRQDWLSFAARDPRDSRAVYLCNPPLLDNAILLKLETFARNGGTVVLFPGDARALEQALPRVAGLEGLKATVKATAEAAATPILPGATPGDLEKRVGVILGGKTSINARKRLVFTDIPASAGRFFEYADGSPFMLTVPQGQGAFWIMSVSANRDWSDWPVTPFFVVLQQELLRQAAGRNAPAHAAAVGETLALEWPEDVTEADFTVQAPGGAEKRVAAHRRASTEPFLLRGFWETGIHIVAKDGVQRPVAVNVPAAENDLACQAAADLAAAMAPATVLPAMDLKEQQEVLAKARRGSPLWPLLLACAFFLAVIDAVAANPRHLRTRVVNGFARVQSLLALRGGGGA